MFRKFWTARAEGLVIEVVNQWNWKLSCRETLIVNGEVVSDTDKTPSDPFKQLLVGYHAVNVDVRGVRHEVVVKLGSKWPGIFMGCHIFLDGVLIGGDREAKLLFTS